MRLMLVFVALALMGAQSAFAGTLQDVEARGRLVCGVSEGLRGFSELDANGDWQGFDVDFCRAVAATVLGDAEAVDYVPLSASERFDALAGGEVDLLSRNSTWTLGRDVSLALDFAGTSYYDGQGFLVPALYGVTNPLQLQGATICVVAGTTSKDNAARFFERAGLQVQFAEFEERDQARFAYDGGACDAYTGDRSALAAERSLLSAPDDHTLLRDVISKEPLGPVVREDDAGWRDLVSWVLFALINAEEMELDAADEATLTALGAPMTETFALEPNWFATMLAQTGDYGDIFARHLGEETPLGLARGLNALWSRGGLLYAPPMP